MCRVLRALFCVVCTYGTLSTSDAAIPLPPIHAGTSLLSPSLSPSVSGPSPRIPVIPQSTLISILIISNSRKPKPETREELISVYCRTRKFGGSTFSTQYLKTRPVMVSCSSSSSSSSSRSTTSNTRTRNRCLSLDKAVLFSVSWK